jgi:hypothetical protein
MSLIRMSGTTEPPTPPSGKIYVWYNTADSLWKFKNDNGDVSPFSQSVNSVNGQTGVVVLDKGDIGLGNVDNTSDLDKPISTATQAALDAISGGKTVFPQYTWLGQLNFDNYLFLGAQNYQPSGDSSNGFQFTGSIPFVVPFNGTITKAIFRHRGIATSTSSPATNVTLGYEVWNVGVTGGQGTKLDDLNVTFPSSGLTIGSFGNSAVNTNLNISANYSISVTQGMLLGLKFNSETGNSNINSFHNGIVSLEISE